MKFFIALLMAGFLIADVTKSSSPPDHHHGLESTEPIKQQTMESKKGIVVYDDGIYGCPDNFQLYVRRDKPPVDKAHPENQQGDFQSFLFVTDGNVLISRNSQRFTVACLREKQ